jgi:GNAT superfamily N-acetyltransferase
MRDIQHDLSTATLVKVIDDNLIARSLSVAEIHQGDIRGPNPRWFITGQRRTGGNGVVRANFDGQDLDTGIKATLRPFEDHNLPLTWWVGPTSHPGRPLRHALQTHGFIHNRDMIGMAVDLQSLEALETAPDALKFEPVKDRATFQQWFRLFKQGFKVPNSAARPLYDNLSKTGLGPNAMETHYVGRLNGEVVGISTLFLGAGVAGLYNLTTQAQARGRGVGALMTVKTFYVARDRGYRIGTLQTTYPNALRMYHQLGFEVYCKISIYQRHKA